MDILLVGSGGREHAILTSLRKNPEVGTIYALPGNGGMVQEATLVPIGVKDLDAIVSFAKEKQVDFAVVAPDDPLVLGLVDLLEANGIPCFGPSKRAAIIEGSKVFAKDLMKRYKIPSARYEVFEDVSLALEYAQNCAIPSVVKADGLALGKGVVVAMSRQELVGAIQAMMVDKCFGSSGNSIVIEEFLTGVEVSVLCFTDGKALIPMVSSMDHKRAYDGNTGPNTGGMGTIAPNPYYTKEMEERCMKEIFLPTIVAMNAEKRTFKGCLYFGLMLTPVGPKVIEYNCRFGDPETQVVLPLLETDLLTIMQSVQRETLGDIEVKFSPQACCCVVLASGGYPVSYETGKPIYIKEFAEDIQCFHAGTKWVDGMLVTSGGRVLNLVAKDDDLIQAIEKAYRALDSVSFDGMQYRKDIGKNQYGLPFVC